MTKIKIQSPAGMHDILPEDQEYFAKIYKTVCSIADFYNFGKIDTSILEKAELFEKSVGESTDIVKKEMYEVKTKGSGVLVLRPEWTASVARAYIEHGMHNRPHPLKLWYFGPCFRHENPQAGRYRQFWQFGFEVFGEKSPVIDAQIIQIFNNILKELKINDIIVEINSLGESQCRGYYKKLLSRYFRKRENMLCTDCKRRLKENVLRILDCKDEECEELREGAPQIFDYLCEECRSHFKEVLEFLDELEINYSLNPYLARGLDYYTKTIFEIFCEQKDETTKKLSLAGGGRYDKLVSILGGKDVSACGAAAGVERIAEIIKKRKISIFQEKETEIFIAQLGNLAKRKSLKLLEELRRSKIRTGESFGKNSLRAQLNRANSLGARYVIIIGQKEALEESVVLRDMSTGKQDAVKISKVVEEIRKRLKKKN